MTSGQAVGRMDPKHNSRNASCDATTACKGSQSVGAIRLLSKSSLVIRPRVFALVGLPVSTPRPKQADRTLRPYRPGLAPPVLGTNAGGLLLGYRYDLTRWLAAEAVYGDDRNTPHYFGTSPLSRIQAWEDGIGIRRASEPVAGQKACSISAGAESRYPIRSLPATLRSPFFTGTINLRDDLHIAQTLLA
jgi:hypothetical protein